MKITLIFAANIKESIKSLVFAQPAGIIALAGMVPRDVEVKLVDMLAGDAVDYAEPTDLVGISVRTPAADIAYGISREFKKRGVKVVLGGPHVTALPGEAALHCDAVAVGEAEVIWPQIIRDFQTAGLKKYYVASPQPFDPGEEELYQAPHFHDLKNLPVSNRNLLPGRRYNLDTVFSTRGCPYECYFCCIPRFFGKKIRHRPMAEVVAEIGTLGKMYFNLDDNILGIPGDQDYYLELYTALAGMKTKRLWFGQAGLKVLETPKGRAVLEQAVKSGLISVSIGIESLAPETLKESGAHKKISAFKENRALERLKKNIALFKELGIFVVGWFITGWDNDTADSYEEIVKFAAETGIAPVITNLSPYPGTRCYSELKAGGRLRPHQSWEKCEVKTDTLYFEHPRLSEKELVHLRSAAMKKAYSFGSILKRSFTFAGKRLGVYGFIIALLTQFDLKKAFC